MTDYGTELEQLYDQRFPTAELAQKQAIWKVLCEHFFQRYVDPSSTVVDIGAGYCEFINNIRAARKIAVDLNPDVARFAAAGVQVMNASCTQISELAPASVDVVFMSNFLEHLPSKQLVLDTLREAHRILRVDGKIIVLQPNIRFLPGEYWDFFDHHVPLSDRSLVEGLQLAGFEMDTVHPRFLPYTTKSRLPKATWLVRMYLRVPLAWRFLGKQALVVAVKRTRDPAARQRPMLATG
ncbi:MAG: methyltransferase domain-containing protein [Rudaea sp.]